MRLALTGASGFIGQHVARAAAAAGAEVVAIARSAASAERARAAGAAPVVAALDRLALSSAFTGSDAVVHLAQVGAEHGADTFEAVNVEGTRQVAAAAWDARVPRIVMLSGLGVARYGQAPHVTNRYFRSKLEAEQALFASSLQVVVLRPSYVLGAGDGFVPWLVRQARSGRLELPWLAGRMQPVAVEDAAEAILRAADPATDRARLFHPGRPPHRVIDLVGPEPLAVRDFVARVFACAAGLGAPIAFTEGTLPVEEALRAAAGAGGWHGMAAGELDCLLCDEVADPGPLQELLGRPLTGVEEALRRAVAPLLFPQ